MNMNQSSDENIDPRLDGYEAALTTLVWITKPAVCLGVADLLEQHVSKEVGDLLRDIIQQVVERNVEYSMKYPGVPLTPELMAASIRADLHPDWTDESVEEGDRRIKEIEEQARRQSEEAVPPKVANKVRGLKGIESSRALAVLGLIGSMGMDVEEMPEPIDPEPPRDLTVEQFAKEAMPPQALLLVEQLRQDGYSDILDLPLAHVEGKIYAMQNAGTDFTFDDRGKRVATSGFVFLVDTVYQPLVETYGDMRTALRIVNSPYKEPTPRCQCSNCELLRTLAKLDIYIRKGTHEPVVLKPKGEQH